MPWTKRSGDPKYGSAAHKRERAKHLANLQRNGSVQCAQPVCIMPRRTIYHGEPTHLGHDDTGQHYIGLVHPACNIKDGAVRGNRRSRGLPAKAAPQTKWVL